MEESIRFRLHSIRTKLLAGAFVAVAGTGMISYQLAAEAVERRSIEGVRALAIRLAENSARHAAALIAASDRNGMRTILNLLAANSDLAYARFTAADGQALEAVHAELIPAVPSGSGTQVWMADSVLHVAAPATSGGAAAGYFQLGFSMTRLQGELKRLQAYWLAVILILAAVALAGLAWFLEVTVSGPLGQIRHATNALAEGNYPKPLAIHSQDEIGSLTEHFNRMVDELLNVAAVKQHLLDQMEESTASALAASRMKSEFLATMSHEIRTPMNGVLGMTSLLLETDLTEEQREFAETVRLSAESLLSIINDILDFSKIEAGKLTFDNVDFDLLATLEGAVELLADRAQAKGLELATLIGADVPADLRGDPGRLRQVLLNIVGNAVKFTDKGEVVVSVAKEGETATHVCLRFSVRDTGMGIDPEAQKRLFMPFVQADGSVARKHGGTGLGLAISKQLVEMMSGVITLESAPAKGSTFSFTVWLHRQAGAVSKEAPAGKLQGLRALVVDDNATNRKILQHYLEAWGMRPVEARSGAEALALLRMGAATGEPYDIAVLDVQMPEMDGFELARSIRADEAIAGVRLVMLSSIATRASVADLNGAQFLSKPVRKRQLRECLANAMGAEAPRMEKKVIAAKPPVQPAEPAGAGGGPRRVLVVDDNVVNQKVTLLLLQRLAYTGEAVNNGKEALNALEQSPFDMILMDCQMPEMDGYEATREIRRLEAGTRHIPIIAMTANAMEGAAQRCKAAGMDDYISKPVEFRVLKEALTRWSGAPAAGA